MMSIHSLVMMAVRGACEIVHPASGAGVEVNFLGLNLQMDQPIVNQQYSSNQSSSSSDSD